MTPGNIVGMAVVKDLDVVALTDHNSCKNCPSFMKIAKDYNIIAIPGMELCTSEEVHVIGLFPTLEDAMGFDEYVSNRLPFIRNNESIFGNQYICDEMDQFLCKESKLLINATTITLMQAYEKIQEYNGLMIPAHIDRTSFSLLSNLGFIPKESRFKCAEIKNWDNLDNITNSNPYLKNCNIISNSDAHSLSEMNEPINTLFATSKEIKDILNALKTK